ncbi:MAG: site-specific integrase [Pseudonocardia sp.]|nr:site-specific integrase [Pseudonocardia sp.]
MLVQRVAMPARGAPSSWTVLGDDDVPIGPVERYLAYLTDVERSPNTVKAYAHDLKDYWTFLTVRGLVWREVRLEGYFGLRLAMALIGRPRMVGIAAFGVAGAYLLLRSTLLPPPGIPLALQLANAVAAAAVLALVVYLALRWDHRGRHCRGGSAVA